MTIRMLEPTELDDIERLLGAVETFYDLYGTYGGTGDDHPSYHIAEAYKSILGAIVDPEQASAPIFPGEP